MPRTIFTKALRLVFATLLLVPLLAAQQTEEADQPKQQADRQKAVIAQPAPVPVQIVNAKRVFISNAGDAVDHGLGFKYAGGVNRPYNELYSAMRSWDRYELVATPADADLILEIHLNSLSSRSSFPRDPEFHLLILDPKTHALLWGLVEPIKSAVGLGWKEKQEKNFNLAIANLVESLKMLSAPHVVASAGQ